MTPAKAPYKLSSTGSFATAGLGGIIGWIIVHPFNTVCVLDPVHDARVCTDCR